MNASSGNTGPRSLRQWRADPSRPGMRRLISPWQHRHLNAVGMIRLASGSIAAAAAPNIAGGTWIVATAHSGSAPA
jgi:hypothetical protein